MLVYTSYGVRDFGADPATSKIRSAWEFWALLSGRIHFEIDAVRSIKAESATLFVFPPNLQFGCRGRGATTRAVFDFNAVPTEVSENLPSSGYYCIPLQDRDCDRIRHLAEPARESIDKPTQFASIQQQAIVAELGLLALRQVPAHPLRGQAKSRAKVDQALAWYATNMADKLTLEAVAQSVHVSASHLRRMFHEVCGKSPKTAFNEIRMERIQSLLTLSDQGIEEIAAKVGLADATALSRAVKKHFGMTPSTLRKRRARQRKEGS